MGSEYFTRISRSLLEPAAFFVHLIPNPPLRYGTRLVKKRWNFLNVASYRNHWQIMTDHDYLMIIYPYDVSFPQCPIIDLRPV